MKSRVIMKPALKQFSMQLAVFLFVLLLADFLSGCFFAPAIIPEELRGRYKTTHLKYEEQIFELDSKLITLNFRGGLHKYYNVKKIKKEIIDNRTLYTILCANEDSQEEFNFAFFIDFVEEITIHFKNKPKVAWKKQGTHVHYKDNAI